MGTESAAALAAKKARLATRIGQDVGNQDGSTTHLIFSVEAPCVLTDDNVPGDRDTTVYADRIEIHAAIHRPGRRIALYAREIVATVAGAGFDVSGASAGATPNALPPAQAGGNGVNGERQNKSVTGGTNGTAGKDGDAAAKGGDAASAGAITVMAYRLSGEALSFVANGGNGAAGQTGQAGGKGGNGGNGADGFVWQSASGRGAVTWHNVNGTNGGASGAGGKGGDGGAGGRGGAAGHVVCRYVETAKAAPIVGATAGTGGKGGGAGAGGAAGVPGNGGSGHDGTSDGSRGAAGANGTHGTAGADGPNGAAGSAIATVVTLADMWGTVHPVQAGLLLQQARLGYIAADPAIKGSFTAPAASLRWLFDITRPFCAAAPPKDTIFGKSDIARLAAVNAQAQSLLTRMSHQRDAFGNGFAWTPCLSYDYCKTTLGALGDQFDVIGAAVDQYITDQATQAERHDAAAAGLAQARSKSASITDRLATVDSAIKSSADDIGTLMDDLETARTTLGNALAGARQAIERKTNCKWDSLLQAAGMVAMMDPETGMFAGVLATQTASATNGIVEQSDYASFDTGQVNKSYLVRQIDTFGSEVTSLDEGYKRLAGSSQLQVDDINCYKVKATAQQIDQALKPYTELAEVQTAIADVDKFLASSQALNDGLFRYNAYIMQKSELLGQKAQFDVDVDDYHTILATLADRDDPGLMAMLMRTYHQVRDECIAMLYMTSRTYGYWAVKRPDIRRLLPQSGDIGPLDIHTAIATVLGDASDANTDFQKINQPFDSPTGGDPNPIVIKDKDVLAAFAKPDKTGSYTLYHALPIPTAGDTIDTNNFAKMRNVRIRELQIYLDGAKSASAHDLTVTVTHGGSEQIANAAGDVLTFESTPSDTQFSYNLATLAISRRATFAATDSDIYAPVGPFCTWTFKIDAALNGKVDLSGLTAVRLIFFGHYL